MIAAVTRLAVDDRARFDEHLDTATVSVIHDDIRAAADGLRYTIDGHLGHVEIVRAANALFKALHEAPTAEVAECPGRLVVVERGVWNGQPTETTRCDVCQRQVSN